MNAPAPPAPLAPLTDDTLTASGARHGFFDRSGGVSEGLFAGLNCGAGSSDEPASVAENRARVARYLDVAPDRLVSAYQVHSADTLVVTQHWTNDARPKVDGLVTAEPDIAIGVLTADCGPLLFSSGDGKIVGAAHAGWKGALTGIAEATVDAMETLGARRESIIAALGPTISAAAYEIGPEFVTRFNDDDPANADFFRASTRDGHAFFDLPGYIARRMDRAGIAGFTDLARCTYADEVAFFSYRRTTHRGEHDYGRLIAAIAPATN